MTKLVNTAGKIVAFVEIEENVTGWHIRHHMDGQLRSLRVGNKDENYEACVLPSGKWQILGDSRTLTEEQMKEICDKDKVIGYVDYTAKGFSSFQSVSDSYSSMKEANEIVDSNPLPDPELTMRQGDGYVYYNASDEEFAEHERIESLVKRFLVLISQE